MNIAGIFKNLDWILIFCVLIVVFFGLITMKSFGNASAEIGQAIGGDYFFQRQLLWLAIGIAAFILALFIDWSFLKTNSVFLLILYFVLSVLLGALAVSSHTVRGASSWLKVSSFNVEPVELMKPALVLVLAKYFSKRHVEIARIFHLIISGAYAMMPIILVMAQPDFGSALVLGIIWLGMALMGGIKLKHLVLLFCAGLLAAFFLWSFVFLPYQKTRILSFLNPQSNATGSGYHALQSMIAIGSGELLGKGIGYGTQSRLEFLPEHATDFIFAAFAEEWGFIGVVLLLLFWSVILWRILRLGIYGESNFEKLYAAGLVIMLLTQAIIHIGMNSGLLPITGLGMPFLSYGGSSIISIFLSLGILESFSVRKKGIFLGIEEKYQEGLLGA